METPKPELVSPVRIPERGPPMTEERRAAWTCLDIASYAYRHNPDDPKKRELFDRAVENVERAYKEAEEQDREQGRRSGTVE